METGHIYLITNIASGKKYVGQTVQKGKRRFSAHKRDAFKHQSPLPLHRAMRKYGIENFTFEIIEECDSIESLNTTETKWILELKTFGSEGYNCTTGGEGFTVSDETRKRMSESRIGMKYSDEHCISISNGMMGEKNHFFGKHHTNESIKKNRNSNLGIHDGELNQFYGKKHSQESLEKMSKSHTGNQIGEKHPRSKLTEKDVLEIRESIKNGINREEIAKKYEVSKGAINKIATRENWSHI